MIDAKFIILLTTVLIGSTAATTTNSTDTPPVKDICTLLKPGAIILRPNSCTNWIKCPSSHEASDFEEGSCVVGLYFNKDKGACDYKENVDCPYVIKEDVNRCDKKKDGVFLADPENCHAYIFCQGGAETHSACPSDLVFHPAKAECVYKQEYKCPRPKKDTKSPLCRSIPDNTEYADVADCSKFHKCVDSVDTAYDCDNGKGYDYVIGRCVQKEEVVCHPTAKVPKAESRVCGTKDHPLVGYFADETSCSSYVVCSKQPDGSPDRDPKLEQCQLGYFYDKDTWSCRDRLNVKCPLDRCEGMGNKYVNVMGDCNAYARCANGTTANIGQCPTKYYFDERTQGCTPQNINYAACAA